MKVIPHGALKVYYVMCSTQGKTVEWRYARNIVPSKDEVLLWNDTGTEAGGWMSLKHCFLTERQAREDWRRRADAETKEHIDILKAAGQSLIDKADRIKVREQCHWSDL